MIILFIILGILLFLFLLTLIPVGVEARYRNRLYCVLKIGFVRIRLLPQKPKKKKKSAKKPSRSEKTKKKKPEKNESFSFKELFKENGVSGLLNILKKILSLITGALKDVFRHIIIKELSIYIVAAGDDAADTAMNYGYVCSAVYPAVSAITQICKCKTFSVLADPDFTDGAKSRAVCRLDAHIRIFWIVKAAAVHGYKALQLLFKYKNAKVTEESKNDNSDNVNK